MTAVWLNAQEIVAKKRAILFIGPAICFKSAKRSRDMSVLWGLGRSDLNSIRATRLCLVRRIKRAYRKWIGFAPKDLLRDGPVGGVGGSRPGVADNLRQIFQRPLLASLELG